MHWKQTFFRGLGTVSLIGGFFAFYDFGGSLLPLFTEFVAGSMDIFEAFIVLTSFFLGVPGLVWIGVRLIFLQNFSSAWLYSAALPITAWLQRLYGVDMRLAENQTWASLVVYTVIYTVLLSLVRFVHRHWFIPLSHDKGRVVGLEKAETSLLYELRWAIIIAAVLIFVISNPSDAVHLFNEMIATVIYVAHWIWQ